MPWGTHFCQFYRTKADLLEILVPYFRCGLEHNEFCMWVASEPLTTAEAAAAMPGFDDLTRQGQIEIVSYTDWYLRDGRFDSDRVLDSWLAKLKTAQARGYDGMRVTGNTFWLEQSLWRDFVAYEDAINRVISSRRMIALCTYPLERCSAQEVIDVAMTHQFALVKEHQTWTVVEPSDRTSAAAAIDKANKALIHDLRSAQRYTRSLIEASLDPLVTIEPGGTITDVNAATEQVTGCSRAELVGREFSAYFTDPELARAGYEQVFRDGMVRDYPLDLRHRDGHTTPVLYNASVYRDDAGQVLGAFAAARDITERKRAEQRLQAALAYNRSLIEASLDPLVTIEPGGTITDVNAATEQVTGCSRAELVGTEFSAYFTDPDLARAGYEQVFRDGMVRDYPLDLRHRDGHTTPVLYNASVYRDDAGQVLGAFAAARDITERKRAEASARRLAAIVESSDDAIISKALDGTILTWNPGAQRLYGYKAEEIAGRPVSVLVPADRREELDDLMRRVARGEHVAHVETQRLPRQGPPLDISLSVSPLLDSSGQVVGVSTIARDITERKRAEQQLVHRASHDDLTGLPNRALLMEHLAGR